MTGIEAVEALARELFRADDPAGVWAADDEATRLHYRRRAQEKLAAERYTEIAKRT